MTDDVNLSKLKGKEIGIVRQLRQFNTGIL